MDFAEVWEDASQEKRRVLVVEVIDAVTVFDDHLAVKVAGAPPLKVSFGEVGLKESESLCVGGPTPTDADWRIGPWAA